MDYFKIAKVYKMIHEGDTQVHWYRLFSGNSARPRALITLWQACHEKLATRSRLHRFGMVGFNTCSFCMQEETQDHLLFDCLKTRNIWKQVLVWSGFNHDPRRWAEELPWVVSICKGKSPRSSLLKLAFAETVYGVWTFRNVVSFGNVVDENRIALNIIDMLVYRGWTKDKLRPYLALLML
ncbi:uncharacterized protein LOC131650970 [Vicia villosa]|uniref:uncharacterized protein LOC131650970 n=1 Tax=Vicia villosa TaxID=3911 RepID=UPI00273CD0EC|nr:uncharacterized protein LOC131650970 [Vicia villosa]